MPPDQLNALVRGVVSNRVMQELWWVHDRGVPVFVHSVDVAALALDLAVPEMDVAAVLVGALVHDVSKLGPSHSYLMRNRPDEAAAPAMEVVRAAEIDCGVSLHQSQRDHVRHIVLSHHGIHGKIGPTTPEAKLVAACDQHSATQHRIMPVDANDVLPFLAEGYRWSEAGAALGVGRELVKARLRDACTAEGVRQWIDLLPIWRQRGRVRGGTPERCKQIAASRDAFRLARGAPESLLERLSVVDGTTSVSTA